MPKYLLVILLLLHWLPLLGFSQELIISTTSKSYGSEEQIWVNLSVNQMESVPGAYKIAIYFDGEKISFLTILPAELGPFAITPASVVTGSTVTVAGFQGISNTETGTTSLATLVFTPAGSSVEIDSTSFSITTREVFSTQAQPIDCKVSRLTTAVLLPPLIQHHRQTVSLTNGYIRFNVLNSGITSVRVFDLNGRIAASPLSPSFCSAGNQAVPIGSSLHSGIYIVTVRGVGLTATKKVEVVR